jgi:hypothetical protein
LRRGQLRQQGKQSRGASVKPTTQGNLLQAGWGGGYV